MKHAGRGLLQAAEPVGVDQSTWASFATLFGFQDWNLAIPPFRLPERQRVIQQKDTDMHIKIFTGALPDGAETPITNTAADLVRMGFNPSQMPQVDRLKALAAAFVSECEAMRDARGKGAREAAIAITEMQGASMFAVAAATADL